MKRTSIAVAALGLITFPLFAGGWTKAQTEQPDEQELTVAAVNQSREEYSVLAYEDYSKKNFTEQTGSIFIGSTELWYNFYARQAGANATDRVEVDLQVIGIGYGPIVNFKVLYFWGDGKIASGEEVSYGPYTIGTKKQRVTLWCDHGGIPTKDDTNTDNRRWNCNFAAVSMQVKLNDHVEYFEHVFNWDDGSGKDSFIYDFLYRRYRNYIYMLSSWN